MMQMTNSLSTAEIILYAVDKAISKLGWECSHTFGSLRGIGQPVQNILPDGSPTSLVPILLIHRPNVPIHAAAVVGGDQLVVFYRRLTSYDQMDNHPTYCTMTVVGSLTQLVPLSDPNLAISLDQALQRCFAAAHNYGWP